MLRSVYTWVVVLFTLLSLYSINIMTFTLADAVLICLFPIYIVHMMIVYEELKLKICIPLFLAAFCIMLHMFMMFLLTKNEVLLPTMRYVSYLLFVAILAPRYFDIKLGWKAFKYVVLFSTMYLFLQYFLMTCCNYFLSGFIPGLPLDREIMGTLSEQYDSGFIRRPYSIFQEPSHYGIYTVLYFGIALLGNYKKERWGLLLTGVGLVLSGSATAILMEVGLLIVWLGKLVKSVLESKESALTIVVIPFFLIVFGICLANTSGFETFMDRTFATSVAASGRFGNYVDLFSSRGEFLITQLFGHGMIPFDGYIPAIPRLYYFFGTVGFALFLLYSFYQLYRKQGYKRIALIILLVSTVGTEILLGKFIVLFLPFIIELGNTYEEYKFL